MDNKLEKIINIFIHKCLGQGYLVLYNVSSLISQHYILWQLITLTFILEYGMCNLQYFSFSFLFYFTKIFLWFTFLYRNNQYILLNSYNFHKHKKIYIRLDPWHVSAFLNSISILSSKWQIGDYQKLYLFQSRRGTFTAIAKDVRRKKL